MSACHTVSQLGLGVEADWAFPHLLCCPKLSMLLPVSRKLHGKRRVGSRRARHNAATFAWTEVPIPPECKSLRTTLVPSWSLGRVASPTARTSHLRRKGSEERKSPPTRGTGTCHLMGLCLLVLTADVIAQVKMFCLLLTAVLCVRRSVKCSGAICQFGFSSYC